MKFYKIIFILLCFIDAHSVYAQMGESGAWVTEKQTVSSPFGPRLKRSDGNRYDFHRGIDIPGDLGDNVYSIYSGIVEGAYPIGGDKFPNGGNVVQIEHVLGGETYFSRYLHLHSFSVVTGQKVTTGQKIGTLGATGDTIFNHLHFEMLKGTSRSLESQLNTSITTGKDPHQNPVRFLYTSNRKSPTYEILDSSPLVVRVAVVDNELDFNEIRIVDGSGHTSVLNFNDRTGFDASSVADLDTQITPHNVTVFPSDFSSSTFNDSEPYSITFRFNDISDYKSITVVDVWGNSRPIKASPFPPIYQLLLEPE